MAKKMNKLPGVLSFQRCLLVTDGLFYNELDNGNLSPLWVMRHGIRGTQNINKASKEGQAASASAKRDEVSNIQTTDSAKLDANASALQVRFNLRGMDIQKALFACAPGQKDSMDDLNAFKADLAAFVDRPRRVRRWFTWPAAMCATSPTDVFCGVTAQWQVPLRLRCSCPTVRKKCSTRWRLPSIILKR